MLPPASRCRPPRLLFRVQGARPTAQWHPPPRRQRPIPSWGLLREEQLEGNEQASCDSHTRQSRRPWLRLAPQPGRTCAACAPSKLWPVLSVSCHVPQSRQSASSRSKRPPPLPAALEFLFGSVPAVIQGQPARNSQFATQNEPRRTRASPKTTHTPQAKGAFTLECPAAASFRRGPSADVPLLSQQLRTPPAGRPSAKRRLRCRHRC